MRHAALALSISTLVLSACAKPEPPPAPAAEPRPRVENATLGVAIAALPAAFELVTNDGQTLTLRKVGGEGEVRVEMKAPELGGVNLVDETRTWETEYAARPEGKFFGQAELGTQFGVAYTVRGSYLEAGQKREERRVYSVHPSGKHILTMAYTYPEGNNPKERAEELFALFAELEALGPAAS